MVLLENPHDVPIKPRHQTKLVGSLGRLSEVIRIAGSLPVILVLLIESGTTEVE